MTQLTDAQIASYARQAGLTGTALVIAVAVCIEESGGETTSHNTNTATGDNSYGLWQINMLGGMGPERRQKFGLKSNDDLFNPSTNAHVMSVMSNGGKNWTAWSTYTSGKYKKTKTWSRANAAAGTNVAVPDGTAGTGTGTATQVGLTDSFTAFTDFMEFISKPNTWLRLGMLLSGGVLLLVAIAKMTTLDNKLQGAAMSAAEAAVTGGGSAVAKTVKKTSATVGE